jgi:glutamyl-tRNA synthetase|tara:strand:+ start:2112 stop:3422 length:1311 start_codon:yes stop_codon:yes gene_type:complete
MKLRIAPSPTGQLHIGNARTALFNWLYAKANNGTFLVRIDDTDTERSTKEFQKDITENLKWLGLHWDEGIEVGGSHDSYKQSSRFDRYQEVAENLLSRNLAYEDDGAIRFKVPNDGSIEFKDYIRGDMLFNLSDVEDFVILRSDKSPTYHLASTVDDIDYGITIIARGEDILSSTPKHIMLMKAMDASLPDFCHLPLLFGPDGKKLSKRHGDTSVEAFKNKGILSEAMFNYLCLLGWSPGNDLEQFDINTAISKFDLKNVLPNSAIFDEKKLLWLNGLYIRSTDIEDFQSTALSQIENDIQRSLFDEEKSRLLKIFPSVQERIETLADLTQQVMFLIDEPFVVDELDWQDVNNEEAQKYLFLLREEFINLDNFSLDSIEIVMRKTLEEINVKTKIGFQAARVSITGTKISPPLFESIFALGREAVIARLAESIEKL